MHSALILSLSFHFTNTEQGGGKVDSSLGDEDTEKKKEKQKKKGEGKGEIKEKGEAQRGRLMGALLAVEERCNFDSGVLRFRLEAPTNYDSRYSPILSSFLPLHLFLHLLFSLFFLSLSPLASLSFLLR